MTARGRKRSHATVNALGVAGLLICAVLLTGTAVVRSIAAERSAPRESRFTISSTVTGYPDCEVPAELHPGVDRCLTYVVHNPLPEPITVGSLSIRDVAAPPGCPSSDLDLSRTTFTGSFKVPRGGTASSPGVPITLRETGENQDGCQGATFELLFTGRATSASGERIGGGIDLQRRPDEGADRPEGATEPGGRDVRLDLPSELALTNGNWVLLLAALISLVAGLLLRHHARRRPPTATGPCHGGADGGEAT